jgi:glycosyltransferase involved in cell wall biosynthesis
MFQGWNSCKYATRSCKNFDYIFCSNNVEVDTLAKMGIRKDRMFCFPFGLSKERVSELIQFRKSAKINQNLVGMVGTLDARKGINFIPKLFDSLIKYDDSIHFKLIGTGGFVPELKNQYLRFSKKVISQMEIVQFFEPSDLPKLISEYSVGIFPSLVEGCPFGLLEMVGAGIPVVGFDSPGISMILPKENLVPANNLDLFKGKIVERLSGAINDKISFPNEFMWEKICSDIVNFYKSLIRDKE